MRRWWMGVLIISVAVGSLMGCGSVEEDVAEEAILPAEDELPDVEFDAMEESYDTDAPVAEWLSDVLFTNSLSGMATADILTYTDESDCSVELTRFDKLSNLEVLDDATIATYEALLNQSSMDELLARTPNKAAGEGIYSAVVTITDTAGNVTAHEILVVYDKTAPTFEGLLDQTITQSDVQIQPQVDLSQVKISDNVDGVISVSAADICLELEDEAKHLYTLHISIEDRAGNAAIGYCTITVVPEEAKKEQPVTASNAPAQADAAQENTLASADTTVQQATSQPSQQPAQKQLQQQSVSYETTTTFQMAAGTEFRDAMAREVLTILNQRRAENGLPALSWDDNLTTVAKVRSIESVSSFSHTRPDGRSFYTALDDQHIGYGWAGENLACGQTSADMAMTEWMASESHKDNILRSEFNKVGIACYYDPNTTYHYYWVQVFSD